MCCSRRPEAGSSIMRQVGTRSCLGNMDSTCCTHGSMTRQLRHACVGQKSLSVAGALKFYDSDEHVEPAASVRPFGKNHEIQTEVQSECNSSVNVCPVVADEMGEEVMDEKEEPSEECRVVRGGQTRIMTPTLKILLTEVEGLQQQSMRTKI